jgi:hypothetical protein
VHYSVLIESILCFGWSTVVGSLSGLEQRTVLLEGWQRGQFSTGLADRNKNRAEGQSCGILIQDWSRGQSCVNLIRTAAEGSLMSLLKDCSRGQSYVCLEKDCREGSLTAILNRTASIGQSCGYLIEDWSRRQSFVNLKQDYKQRRCGLYAGLVERAISL